MTHTRRRFAAVAFIALTSLGHGTSRAQSSAETRAASMLFQQFETVVYARTDFPPRSDAYDPKNVDSEDELKLPFVELIGALDALGPNTAKDLQKSYGTVLVGAKDFGSGPDDGGNGLGMFSSRKCYIGVLADGDQPNLKSKFLKASTETFAGRQVWTWLAPSTREEARPIKVYAAQVAGSYLVLADNRQDFEQAVKVLASAENSKPESISVPGWGILHTHKYWAYRFIRRNGTAGQDLAGGKELTPDVTALTFFADLDKRESFFQVFSSDKTMKIAPKILPKAEFKALQHQGTGIWQATIPLSKDEAAFDTLFGVFYFMGFGVAL